MSLSDHYERNRLALIACAQLGVREEGGNNNGPKIREYQAATWLEPAAWPWCFTGDVELLTESGWVAFSRLGKSAGKVAQVRPVGDRLHIELVEPLAYIKKAYKGQLAHVKNRTLDFECDVEHRFWGSRSRAGEDGLTPIKNITDIFSIPFAESGSGGCDASGSDIDLAAGFIADGFFHKGFVEFQVSRSKKIEFLNGLSPRRAYTASRAYGLSKVPLTTIVFDEPSSFANIFGDYKLLRWDWIWSLSREQALRFIQTYAFFDGHQRGTSFVITTSRKEIADRLVAVATLAGLLPCVSERPSRSAFNDSSHWVIRFCPTKKTRTIRKKDIKIRRGSTDLYCVTVPSGLILVRDAGGTPFVTGNCAAFVDWCVKMWITGRGNDPLFGKETGESWRPKTAGALDLLNWARLKNLRILTRRDSVEAGDIVVYDEFSHCGFVVQDAGASQENVRTVEGNTGPAGLRDSESGDGVFMKKRNRSLVRSFIRMERL